MSRKRKLSHHPDADTWSYDRQSSPPWLSWVRSSDRRAALCGLWLSVLGGFDPTLQTFPMHDIGQDWWQRRGTGYNGYILCVSVIYSEITGTHPWTIPPENPKCSEKDSCKDNSISQFTSAPGSYCQVWSHSRNFFLNIFTIAHNPEKFLHHSSLSYLYLLEHIRVVTDLPELHNGVH